jgi:methionyl-tRNA synthetase
MKPTIEYPDFEKLDLRVGKILEASAPEWSEKLLEFRVDLGSEIGEKTILSAIKAWYAPEEFMGKHYVFIVNLAERKMGEGISQGMMIMADGEPQPVPFAVPESIAPGTVVR